MPSKTTLIFLAKFTLATVLISWLISSGKMDLSLLTLSSSYYGPWAICLFFIFFNTVIVAYRWQKLLEIKAEAPFSYFSVLKMTMIGNMFNSILPGLVSGDFIKLFYAKKHDPSMSKAYLLTSVLLDRIFGLFGLLSLLGLSTLFNYHKLISLSPEMASLIHLNTLIFAGMAFFLLSLFLPSSLQKLILSFLKPIPKVGNFATHLLSQFWAIGQKKSLVCSMILISMISQSFNIVAFWILASPFLQYVLPTTPALTLTTIFSFLPLGFVATAIPITPSGLGVGHVAFDILFGYYGVTNGASLFNFNFLSNLIINLLGVFPYLFGTTYGREKIDLMENKNFF